MGSKTITRKISIFINGKEVKNNLNEVGKEIGKLKGQLRNLVPGTQEFINKSKELKVAQKAYANINNEIRGTQGLLSKIKTQVGPVGSAFAAAFSVTAIISFANGVIDVIQQFRTLKQETKQLTGLTGELLDGTVSKVKALADTFNGDYKEILQASNTLVKQLDVSYSDALETIEKGYLAGANVSGDMLEQIKEYAPFMKEANIELDEMVALIAQTEKEGIFNDKGIDAIKEATLRIREGTTSTREAIDALGIDSKKMYKDLADGTISYFEAMQLISTELSGIEDQSPVVGQAIADIFGGPGEDAGLEYLQNIKDIDLNLNNLVDTTDEYTQLLQQEADVNEALNSSWVKLTETGGLFSNIMVSLKGLLAQTLEGISTLGKEDWEIAAEIAIKTTEEADRVQRENEEKQFKDYIERRKKRLGELYDFEKVKAEYLDSIRTSIQNRVNEGDEKAMKKYLKIFEIADGFANPDGEVAKKTTTGESTEEKEANEKAAAARKKAYLSEAAAKKKAFEVAEAALNNTIAKQQEQRIINQKTGLDKELAQIDAKYRTQIEKAEGHEEQQKQLEALRDQEKTDLKLQRAEEAKQRVKEWEAQNRIEEEAQRFDQEAANAITEEERITVLLEKTKWIANEQLRIEQEKEIARLNLIGATDAEIAAVKQRFLLQQKQVEAEFAKGKQEADKQTADNEIGLTRLRTQAYANMFGGVAQLLGEQTAAGKAAAIAQSTINTFQGITEVWKTPSVLPEPMATISRGISTATVLASGIGAVKSITSTKEPTFFYGGHTGSSAVSYDQYGAVTGNVHDDEYVVPKIITQDPTYAPIINQLENKRVEATGQTNSLPAEFESTSTADNSLLTTAVYQLIAKLDEPLLATSLIGDNQINDFNQRNDQLKNVRNNAKVK